MKKQLTVLFFVFIFTELLYSQSGWVQVFSNSSNIYTIAFLDVNIGMAAGEGSSVYRTTDGGQNWNIIPLPSNVLYLRGLKFVDSNTVIGFNSFYIVRSTNSGLNWTASNIPYQSFYSVASRGNTVLLGGALRIIRSTDKGLSWSVIDLQTIYPSAEINSLTFTGLDTCYAVSFESNPPFGYIGRIFKSINDGMNWAVLYQANGISLKSVHFVNSNTGFVCSDFASSSVPNFYYTSNAGANWTVTTQNYMMANCVYFTGVDAGYLGVYGGADAYLKKSTDHGQVWNNQFVVHGTGGYSCEIYSITFNNANTGWFCGYRSGTGGVIFKTTDAGGPVDVFEENNIEPKSFLLSQNYPNPFNPTTKIKFDIPASLSFGEGLSVRLYIFDILGREVATLVNEQLRPGSYEAEWDGSNFASGIYFYSIQTDQFTQTKKMVLMK
jgi:photosystem II stability/assembly factor-like uncharacterized protein